MSGLDETVLPPVWSLIRSELAGHPTQTRDELVSRLTPAGLIARAGDAGRTSRHVWPSLRALTQLGVVTSDADHRLSLLDSSLTESAFRSEVAQRLLGVPDEDDPFALRQAGQQPEYHAELAMAWLHLQGFEHEVAGWQAASPLLDRQLGTDRVVLRDTAPFNTFERLARWLGVAVYVAPQTEAQQSALIPDPTDLIREALTTLVPNGAIATVEFLRATAERFPWLPHGRIGRAVAERLPNLDTVDRSATEEVMPQSVSLALTRLQLEQRLVLEEGDDPKQRVLLQYPGGGTRGVARVVIT